MARRRVHGPYAHFDRWRIIVVGEDGTRAAQAFDSEDEAAAERRRIEDALEEHQGLTVTEALDAYELHQRAKGNKPRSIETTRGRISRLLAPLLSHRLRSLTERACAKAYAELQAAASVDTHRNALNETRTFLNWCAARPRRWLRVNPLAEVRGEGKRHKGKPQLRIDECRAFAETARRLADAGDVAGIVALACLYLGTRITELIVRPVRDLDDEGRLLWIPDSKTPSGRRFLDVPEDLGAYLLRLAKGKAPESPMFPGVTRYMARNYVQAVCKAAGVPVVGPHGLRGTHASIARERGATAHLIASAVGHGSYAVTQAHYLRPGTEERATARAALGVLQGGRGNSPREKSSRGGSAK